MCIRDSNRGIQSATTASAPLTETKGTVGSFGIDISLPTGFLARALSFGNEGVRDFLCNVVDHIDIKTPDNFPFAAGLIPLPDSCNEDFCPTKHALYLGTRPCKK